MTNNSELSYLYQQISAHEMLQKLKSCGLSWESIGIAQYKAEIESNSILWQMYLTKDRFERVVLDFRKDGVFHYSLNSVDEPILTDLFNQIDGDPDYEKDREMLEEIGNTESCS